TTLWGRVTPNIGIGTAAVSADGRLAAIHRRELAVWGAEGMVGGPTTVTGQLIDLTYTAGDRRLAARTFHCVMIWDAADPTRPPVRLGRGLRDLVYGLAAHPSAPVAAIAGKDGRVRLIDTHSCQIVRSIDWK